MMQHTPNSACARISHAANLTNGTAASRILKADMHRVLAVLGDSNGHSRWVPFLRESCSLETASVLDRLEYNRFALPWPVRDRDFVFRTKAALNHGDKGIVFIMRSEPSPLMPARKGIVRGALLDGSFRVIELAPGRCRVELTCCIEPRGRIPAWLAALLQRAWPRLVLRGLKSAVKSEGRSRARPAPNQAV